MKAIMQKSVKRERLEARVTAEQKALIQRAADLSGRSLTDFMVGSAEAEAEATIHRHEIMHMTGPASVAFVEALLEPAEPNEALQEAIRRYRAFMSE